jgi:hypothetical protein
LTIFFHFFSKKHKLINLFYFLEKKNDFFFVKNCPLKMGAI